MTRAPVVRAVALLASAAALGCARPYPPPGGETPQAAPAVIETVPAALAVEPDFRGAVVFRFDRRLSEQGEPNPVIVSPATSPVRISRGRTELRVALRDGWEPGRIYRVVVLPGVRDLFGNRTTEPLELVFSTGPAIPETAVAGIVTERLTGRPARNAIVEALQLPDSVLYLTAVDTAGFFALRHLPQGEYEALAFADVNRNRRREPTEPVSEVERITLATAADTVPLLLAVLPPDTTPARLARAEAVDSLTVRLHFDDYFDADTDLAEAAVRIFVLPDSVPGPAGELLTAAAFAELQRARAPAPDDVVAPRPADAPRPGRDAAALPARELVFLAAAPLLPGGEYVVSVSGVTNIHGIPGGGGEARFTVPARPAEPVP
jgi:hypothetical protein